jgi:enterochelin esterase-like enzyme
MKRVSATLVALCMCFTSAAYAGGTVEVTSFVHPDPRIGTRFVQVYLPEGYDPGGSTDYPSIYFLHGAKDGVDPGYANHLSYPFMIGILDSLIGNDIIHPVIAIKPNSQCSPYLISWHTNSILNGPWENYTYLSLVDFAQANYRVIPDANYRYLMGHSAGGHGVIKVALKHLDVFSAIATHSGSGFDIDVMLMAALPLLLAEYPEGPPYLWNPTRGFISASCFSLAGAFSPNLTNPPFYVNLPLDAYANIIPSVWQLWLDQSPPNIAATVTPGDCPRIYFDCGMQDELGAAPQNVSLHNSFATLGIEHTFEPYTGGHFDKLPERFPIGIAFLVGLKAHVYFQPTILHLGSSGSWVTCHIALPGDYLATDIDPSTVVLNKINGVTIDPPMYREGPIEICEYRGEICLMVKFNRQDLVSHLYTMGISGRQVVELGIAGELTNGIPFHDVGALNVKGTAGPQGNEMAGKIGSIMYKCTPNPFSSATMIQYESPNETHVRVTIYNAVGQPVATLVDARQEPGSYSLPWEGKYLPNGVYICRMETNDCKETQKLLLMR